MYLTRQKKIFKIKNKKIKKNDGRKNTFFVLNVFNTAKKRKKSKGSFV